MSAIDDVAEMIKFYKAIDLNQLILSAVQDNEHIVVDMVAEEQLFEEGITGNNVSIASFAPYAPYTVQIKTLKGQPTNRVTLRDEGDFEKSFFVSYGPDYFEIKATDWKTEKLTFEYGEDILKVTEENQQLLLTDYIVPYIIKKLTYGSKD